MFDLRLAFWQSRGHAVRAGLLIVCIAVGVSAQVAIHSFVDQMNGVLEREARNLLTADLEISKSSPFSETETSQLASVLPPSSQTQNAISFVTMAAAESGPATRLVELRAVEDGYPFYGKIELAGMNGANASLASMDAEVPGIFVQPELLPQMDLKTGNSLKLGQASFMIAGTVNREPGLGGGIFSLGPRIFMRLEQVPATNLLQTGSRAYYVTYVALQNSADAEKVAENLKKVWNATARRGGMFSEGLGPGDSITVRTYRDKQNQMQRSFERLADYLRLVSLIALLLGGIGIGSVVGSYIRENLTNLAVLKTLGASEARIMRVTLLQISGVSLVAGLLGAALGTLVQNLFPVLFASLLPVPLEASLSVSSILSGLALGVGTSIYFSILPILQIRGLKPLPVMRGERASNVSKPLTLAVLAAGAVLLSLTAIRESRSVQLGLLFSGTLLAASLIIFLLGKRILPLLQKLRSLPFGFGFRHGLANLQRPGLNPHAAIVTLGLASLLLGFMTVYQYSLTRELEPGKDSARLPNLFLIDLQDDQIEDLKKYYSDSAIRDFYLSPIVKARYRGKSSGEKNSAAGERDAQMRQYMRNREQNLSFRDAPAPDEQITRGRWIDPSPDKVEVSLEESFAERLDAKVGDRVTFDVQGVEIEADVTSLRKVRWASFKPNFFILMSPHALLEAPKTWVGSVSGLAADQKNSVQRDLVRLFPNVTIFDVAEGGKRLLKFLSSIYGTVRFVALFSILAGLLVLSGVALTTAQERRAEATLLKILGGTSRTVLASTFTEFFFWGSVSVGLGILLSIGFSWGILTKYLELDFAIPWRALSLLSAGMIGLCAAVGLLFSRRIFNAKPLEVLRLS